MPRVIVMRRGKKLPPHTKAVDRRSKWGNPFIAGRDGPGAEDVVRMFACHLLNSDHLLSQLKDLTALEPRLLGPGMGRDGRITIELSCAPVAPACQYTRVAGEPTLIPEYAVLPGRQVGVGFEGCLWNSPMLKPSCHYLPWCSRQHSSF